MKKTHTLREEITVATETASVNEADPKMFSAATFFDVVDALPAQDQHSSAPVPPAKPHSSPAVVAFYGFRGGAGRTLSLAHVAALLTSRGARVCVVDLDLEAPGADAVFGVTKSEPSEGAVALLRSALTQPSTEPLSITPSLRSREISGRKLHILPAGRIDQTYLAQIEELGIALWHLKEESPLSRLVRELGEVGPFDVICLDCRTGFSGLSASALFHVADLIVTFLPLSEQVWDGLEILLRAVRASRFRRQLPEILLCPSMIPQGQTGRQMLDKFVPKLRDKYVKILGEPALVEEAEDPDQPALPILQGGIRYDAAIAEAGSLDLALQATSWKNYELLADEVSRLIDLQVGEPRNSSSLEPRKILNEIKLNESWAFAEELSPQDLAEQFVAPGNLAAAIDRSTTLILGTKGAGKTWLWRYLISGGKSGSAALPPEIRFAIGHGPNIKEGGELQLSSEAFKEIESAANLRKEGSYAPFWRLYCLARLAAAQPALRESLPTTAKGIKQQKLVTNLLTAEDAHSLQNAIVVLLKEEGIGTLSERLLFAADEALLAGDTYITLAFDGLDTGFGSGSGSAAKAWLHRQEAFTTALLEVMSDVRARFRRLSFKVFLREDIFLRLVMQNKSHLEPAKLELRWRPEDWWRIVLNIVCTSPTYRDLVQELQPGVTRPWNVDEQTLRRLLAPLWGEKIDTGRAGQTANYIAKRTADAQERLFPRTLVQLLHAALEAEKAKEPLPRATSVIRFSSLRDGVAKASEQRVEDLKKEYVELSAYLDALRGADATGDARKFINHLSKSESLKKRKESLQLGTGGWEKVIQRLKEVGVLGPYRGDKSKLAVAQLYREGLGIRGVGI